MRSITLHADDQLIDAALECAEQEQTTLDAKFEAWLREYTEGRKRADRALESIKAIRRYTGTGGRKFTREEMNER